MFFLPQKLKACKQNICLLLLFKFNFESVIRPSSVCFYDQPLRCYFYLYMTYFFFYLYSNICYCNNKQFYFFYFTCVYFIFNPVYFINDNEHLHSVFLSYFLKIYTFFRKGYFFFFLYSLSLLLVLL